MNKYLTCTTNCMMRSVYKHETCKFPRGLGISPELDEPEATATKKCKTDQIVRKKNEQKEIGK